MSEFPLYYDTGRQGPSYPSNSSHGKLLARIEELEAANERLQGLLHRACDLLDSARCDYGDPQLRRNWGMKRKRLLDAEYRDMGSQGLQNDA